MRKKHLLILYSFLSTVNIRASIFQEREITFSEIKDFYIQVKLYTNESDSVNI